MQLTPTITNGVKLFVQLTALRSDPLEAKWVRDEDDLRIALSQIADEMKYTKSMLGKKMYKTRDAEGFDFVDDVKRAIEETLLVGEDERDTRLMRKKNLTMYHLVLEPVIEWIGTLSHADAIQFAREYTDAVYEHVATVNVNTHFDDAVVAKSIVKSMVKEREEARKATLLAQRRGRRNKKKEDELMKEFAEPTEEDIDLE